VSRCDAHHRQEISDRYTYGEWFNMNHSSSHGEAEMSSSTELREMAEYHARECVRAANLTDDAENRELLLKMAREWAQEAQRRGSHASLHPDDTNLRVEPRA
jgi:hypothetical protein